MSDPSLFAGMQDLTGKEFVKRYNERRQQISITNGNEAFNRPENATRPPPRRVETDPTLWQGETTVRTIHDPSVSSGSTPPGLWKNPDDQPSPYHSQNNSFHNDENSNNHSQRRDWRNSGWGRQGSGLGVSGQ